MASNDAPMDSRAADKLMLDPVAVMTEGGSAMFEQAIMAPVELTRFYARRMSHDLETMQAIGRCRTPAEIVNVWAEAAQTAAEDYREELTRMMTTMGNGAMQPMKADAPKSRRRSM